LGYKKISVVIPAYNDAGVLRTCLSALVKDLDSDTEVIVVDDGSGQSPADLVSVCCFHLVTLSSNQGPAAARNAGVKASSGEIILFTDADCVPMPGWGLKCAEALHRAREASPLTVALCGRLTQRTGFWEQCHAYAGYAYVQSPQRRETDFLNTACAAVFRDAFDAVGGFSADMRVSEDPELALKLVERGYKIVYDPDITVFHDHGIDSCARFFKKHRDWGYSVGITLLLKHPRKAGALIPWLRFWPTHFLLIVPLAFMTTFKIVWHNITYDHKVLVYAPFIFVSKIFYRWGIWGHVRNTRFL
jgi:cellulose synthase/poly-beta-1,6-N-acetylglucosamine synthase-like glycosyltransferase